MNRLLNVLILMLTLAAWGHAETSAGRKAEAQSLYESAEQRLVRGTIDDRRLAIRDLERATLLDPERPDIHLTLGRTYYEAGFLKYARQRFERVLALAPDDPDSRFGLGWVWRRDWLKYLERKSLDRAIEHFSTAARMRPQSSDFWIALVPLLVETRELRAAAAAAAQAQVADPQRPEVGLAVAHTAYQLGDLATAEGAFSRAIPHLPPVARERFEDISPVATERDTFVLRRLDPASQREFVRRFWKDLDPDLATPENEAQLEYWSRVAHAYFLFFSARREEWDLRGEIYVRYGPPSRTDYNPLGVPLSFHFGARSLTPTGVAFPMNVLVWDYPELGMTVQLQDRLLSEFYLLPITYDHDPDPSPHPDSLRGHDDRIASQWGRGVFRTLPPGVGRLPVTGAIARFEAGSEARLFVQVESRGSPGDSMLAEWVVLDSTRTEVARGARALSPSACDPIERRVADFAGELPPGAYRVGLTVRDRAGRRGVFRADAGLEAPRARLALSDLVVTCGVPEAARQAGARTVRLDANPAAHVADGEALSAYFEIYHLRVDAEGQSRFEYTYTVRSNTEDKRIWIQRVLAPRRDPPPISVRREESNRGELRRQFVTVPVQSLPAGAYKLEIRVRDLQSGSVATGETEFVRVSVAG